MNLEDLVAPVSAIVGPVPAHVMQYAITTAVREFYSATKVWVYETSGSLSPQTTALDLDIPEGASLYAIREISVGGEPVYDRGGLAFQEAAKQEASSGQRVTLYARHGAQLRVAPAQLTKTEVAARVVLLPTPTATEIDDYTGTKYFDTLVQLAAKTLFKMPAKDWTSNVGAQDYAVSAQAGLYEATQEATHVQDTQRLTSEFGGDGYW